MPTTLTTEEQVPFNPHEFDQLGESQSDAAFSVDECMANRHHHDHHHVLLRDAFMPPKNQNCDRTQYNGCILDTKSVFVPVAKHPSYRLSLPEISNHFPTDTQSSDKHVIRESSHSISQRASLSDLHSHYWKLLKTRQINREESYQTRKPLISQITKEMTVVNEESEVKARIASLLGKNIHRSRGCFDRNLLIGSFLCFFWGGGGVAISGFVTVVLTWENRQIKFCTK